MNIKYYPFLQKLFWTIIVLWVIIAGIRFIYNMSKIFTEELSWVYLKPEEKRIRLYGDLESIYVKINTVTINSDCLSLITNDDTSYFFLRYQLYPKHIYWVSNFDHAINTPPQPCRFVLFYNTKPDKNTNRYLKGENKQVRKITIFSDNQTKKQSAVLYKIQ